MRLGFSRHRGPARVVLREGIGCGGLPSATVKDPFLLVTRGPCVRGLKTGQTVQIFKLKIQRSNENCGVQFGGNLGANTTQMVLSYNLCIM